MLNYLNELKKLSEGSGSRSACAVRFSGTVPHDLVLRTDNGPQYISRGIQGIHEITGNKI